MSKKMEEYMVLVELTRHKEKKKLFLKVENRQKELLVIYVWCRKIVNHSFTLGRSYNRSWNNEARSRSYITTFYPNIRFIHKEKSHKNHISEIQLNLWHQNILKFAHARLLWPSKAKIAFALENEQRFDIKSGDKNKSIGVIV